MNLKTYRAYSMAEALAAVKQDLGDDAVILNTRSFKRGGIFGLGARTIIEVTATPARSIDEAAISERAKAASTRPHINANSARLAYKKNLSPAKSRSQAPAISERDRTKRLAQAMAEIHSRDKSTAAMTPAASSIPPAPPVSPAPPVPPAPVLPVSTPELAEKLVEVKNRAPEVALKAVKEPLQERPPRRFILTPSDPDSAQRSELQINQAASMMPAVSLVAGGADAPGTPVSAMQTELSAIKDLVGQVLQRQVTAGQPHQAMPQQLFNMYLHLVGQDLSEELADQVISNVRDTLQESELEDELLVRERVFTQLASFIPVANEPLAEKSNDGRPLTIALVGPTGVGKTTTLAKIAATFKLKQNKSVGLITADTYRIAAVDQLRTYANIIGLPLKVVLTPAEMRQAVHALRECDVILIDTAGRSQNDAERLDELKQFIEEANPHEVHLVLSTTASEKVLLREAEAFSRIGIDKLVLTKLDEAVSFGVLINVIRQVGKKLSFFTTGQEVPHHIEAGRADRLASLVMEGSL